MRQGFFQQMIDKIDLVELVSNDTQLKKRGGRYFGWHTVHQSDSKQSLCVWEDKSWFCFSCKKGGTVIDYVMVQHGLSVRESIGWLCTKYGITNHKWTPEQIATYKQQQVESASIKSVLTDAASYYHETMGTGHRSYFKSRGLNSETIDKYKLGYADGSLYSAFTQGGMLTDANGNPKYSQKELLWSSLFKQFKDKQTGKPFIKDSFEGRYIFPYWQKGQVAYMIARRDTDDEKKIALMPKWNQGKYVKLSTNHQKHPYISKYLKNDVFYGEDSVFDKSEGIITEGPMDCLMAIQAGFSAIAPASNGFSDADFFKLDQIVERWKTVYMIFDSEESGEGLTGAVKTAQDLFEAGHHVKIVQLPLPEGKVKLDLAEFLKQ